MPDPQFELWHRARAGEDVFGSPSTLGDIEHRISGYWRRVGARTKHDDPVAITIHKPGAPPVFMIGAGKAKNAVEHADEWARLVDMSIFKFVPVLREEWEAAIDPHGPGRWADGKPSRPMKVEERLDVAIPSGDNAPPLDESLRDQIAALAEKLDATPEPDGQEAANKLTGDLDRMRLLLTKAEDARKAEKEPHLRAGQEVDARWADIRAPGLKAGEAAGKRRAAWLKREQAKKEAEARAEYERRRKEAEAAANAERERLAAEARKQAELTGADEAEVERHVAEVEAAAPPVVVEEVKAERVVAGSAFGRKTGLRTYKVAVIDDLGAVAAYLVENKNAELIELCQRVANAAAKAGITVPGTHATTETK